MPFTATHVAAAVPIAWLCRWRVPFSALAIGTIIPDLGVFFPWLCDYRASHTATGVLTHCTPIGMVIYYAFHLILKRPLVDLLPDAARNRLLAKFNRLVDFRLRQIALVACLIAVGASTHVFWDSFTHIGRWGAELVPILNETAWEFRGWPITWATVLQHGSSAVFLPPLVIGFLMWTRSQEDTSAEDTRLRVPLWASWSVIAAVLAGGALRTLWIQFLHPNFLLFQHSFRFAVKDTGAIAAFIVLAYCIGMQIVWALRDHRTRISEKKTATA